VSAENIDTEQYAVLYYKSCERVKFLKKVA
jgi:hypothetical protein